MNRAWQLAVSLAFIFAVSVAWSAEENDGTKQSDAKPTSVEMAGRIELINQGRRLSRMGLGGQRFSVNLCFVWLGWSVLGPQADSPLQPTSRCNAAVPGSQIKFFAPARRQPGTEKLGTGRAALHPGFDQGPELLLRSRSRGPPSSRLPTPTHQRIFGHVVNDLVEAHPAVPIGVLDLGADLAERLAGPRHFNGRQVPCWMSRYTAGIEIGALVACRALHADGTEAACASHHQWLVRMSVVPLLRTIARRVAIHASGMLDYFARLDEEGDRPLPLIRNGGKLAGGLERADRLRVAQPTNPCLPQGPSDPPQALAAARACPVAS